MTSTAREATTKRYDRYRVLIEFIAARDEFSLAAVKQSLSHEKPAFITRNINDLTRQGWIIRENEDCYSWNRSRGEFSVNQWLDQRLYGSRIKASPEQERPRERLLRHGADSLRVADLLAILIRSGRPGESAVEAGQKLANRFQNRLEELPAAGRGELKSISAAVADTAFCQIMAGIELGRRVADCAAEKTVHRIRSSSDAIRFCQIHFSRLASDRKQEEFHIVSLDTKNQVIDTHQITVGTLDASLVHPREVFRPAIKDAASSVILVHNHPSGDPAPSPEDFAVTRRLESSGDLLGIEVLDHIVLGREAAISIRESQ